MMEVVDESLDTGADDPARDVLPLGSRDEVAVPLLGKL